jgi:hypothetical protein
MLRKSRIDYWSCSKFANFIRGTKKPGALGWEEWEDWHKEAKNKHPIRYWMAEEGLSILQNIVNFPSDLYYTIKVYIRNRWIDKLHYLKTGLKPGEYYDLDYRIMHGLFNELVDLVEVEYAHLSTYDKDKKYNFVNGRCVEAGLDYLNWAASLTHDEFILKDDPLYCKPTPQAIAAQKTLKIYQWWKNRPNRPDPMETSGWSELHGERKKLKKRKKAFDKLQEIEQQYEDEDTEMMIELIKIRKNLWT